MGVDGWLFSSGAIEWGKKLDSEYFPTNLLIGKFLLNRSNSNLHLNEFKNLNKIEIIPSNLKLVIVQLFQFNRNERFKPLSINTTSWLVYSYHTVSILYRNRAFQPISYS